jgi:hypothetical protein
MVARNTIDTDPRFRRERDRQRKEDKRKNESAADPSAS